MNMILEKKVDALADMMHMMQKGFKEFRTDLDNLAIAVKNGFDHCATKDQLDEANYRLDRIENISVGGHERRIEILEDKVGIINTKLGFKRG